MKENEIRVKGVYHSAYAEKIDRMPLPYWIIWSSESMIKTKLGIGLTEWSAWDDARNKIGLITIDY